MNPETVLAAAWQAFTDGDGRALATLATDESLTRYQEALIAEVRRVQPTQSLDHYLAEMEHLPRAVAEYQWHNAESHRAEHVPRLLRMYPGTMTIDELTNLHPHELLTRAMRALPTQLRLASLLPGHVLEPPDRAFVLLRLRWKVEAAGYSEPPEIATLRYVADEWRLELDPLQSHGMPNYEGFWYAAEHNVDTGAG
ncbi:MAG: hypothetical protein ABJE10_00935 [bacterium]